MDDHVLAAMQPYFAERFYNPSATYMPAVAVRRDVDAARARIAHWLGARRTDIIFTAGGTEANNLAIQGVMAQHRGKHVVVSAIEHESVLRPAHQHNCTEVPVDAAGIVPPDAVVACITNDTVLVSVMCANNEIGTVQPIRHIAQAVQRVRRERQAAGNSLPLYLHTDAAQAAAYMDLHASRLGVDMLTLNGGKIYGPKQCGVLFAAAHVRLSPQVLGGGQERGIRSGTENVPGIIGLAAALDLVQERRHAEVARLQTLQQLFFDELAAQVPQARVNGSRKHRLPNNVHITVPGQDNERLLLQLEQQGILCAAGSACSASNDEPSHVLRALGCTDADARASLRFTMGASTNMGDIRRTAAVLAQLTRDA